MADSWAIRPYDASLDESGVVYLWLKSFAHSSFGRATGAHVDGSDAERAYWASHRDVVLKLLKCANTQVLCDPDSPGVIWAFACVSEPDVVHYAVVKRKFKEFSGEMFRALLGDRFDKACTFTHDLSGTGLQAPRSWVHNPYTLFGVA